jgi:hypothetical protein
VGVVELSERAKYSALLSATERNASLLELLDRVVEEVTSVGTLLEFSFSAEFSSILA